LVLFALQDISSRFVRFRRAGLADWQSCWLCRQAGWLGLLARAGWLAWAGWVLASWGLGWLGACWLG